VARGGHYGGKKRPITYSPDGEVGGALLGWYILSFKLWFDDDWSFLFSPYFLSPGPWYSCRAFKKSILSFNLYLFWI